MTPKFGLSCLGEWVGFVKYRKTTFLDKPTLRYEGKARNISRQRWRRQQRRRSLRSKINYWTKSSNNKGADVTKAEVMCREMKIHTFLAFLWDKREWGQEWREKGKESFQETMIHGTEKLRLLVAHGLSFFWKPGGMVICWGVSRDNDLCIEAIPTSHSPSTNLVHWRSKHIRPWAQCSAERILEGHCFYEHCWMTNFPGPAGDLQG